MPEFYLVSNRKITKTGSQDYYSFITVLVEHKFHLVQSFASVIKESTLYIFTSVSVTETLHHPIELQWEREQKCQEG